MELVSVPFSVTADVARSTAPLRAGEPTESVRNQKRAEFNGPLRSELLGQLPGCAEGLSLLARDLGLRGEALEDLALGCREDLALLHDGVLTAIAFAFPSGFRPTAKLGQDFAAVHAPVADGEVLRAASAGITADQVDCVIVASVTHDTSAMATISSAVRRGVRVTTTA